MEKPLVLISAQPDNPLFFWQVAVNLRNQREWGTSDKARVLVFLPKSREKEGFHGGWKFLENKFPEVQFFYYKDPGTVEKTWRTFRYIPLLRPYCLQKHFEQFPELKDAAVFYHDSDIVFTKSPDWLYKYKDDDINYLSDTASYIGAGYFDSKEKDVRDDKKEAYKKIDPLGKVAFFCGTDRETCENNQGCSGGAQYLLKNIDSKFWAHIFDRCIDIKTYLSSINQEYFRGETVEERENNGFQAFCADMWAILFSLWGEGKMVITPEEMDFAHATDRIEKWYRKGIYHDAGAPRGPHIVDGKEYLLFYKKGQYVEKEKGFNIEYTGDWGQALTPFEDYLGYVSPEFASYNYVKEILLTKQYLEK